MFKRKTFIFSIGLAIILLLCSTIGVMADSDKDQINLSGMTLSEFEAMFPMSAEEEAAIIHGIPQVPVLIDGVLYEPEEIALFNGQRLRFAVDSEGVLNAFTSVEGIEQFIAEESDQPAPQGTPTMGIESTGYGRFYEHWWYGGSRLKVSGGIGIGNLGSWNDEISSVAVDDGVWGAVMFEHIEFGGDSFWCDGGDSYPILWLYGWNDIASSLAVFP